MGGRGEGGAFNGAEEEEEGRCCTHSGREEGWKRAFDFEGDQGFERGVGGRRRLDGAKKRKSCGGGGG